jgi:hypothetical protein
MGQGWSDACGQGFNPSAGGGSFELRVYGGTDSIAGKRRWLPRTVRGDRSEALRELKALGAHAK